MHCVTSAYEYNLLVIDVNCFTRLFLICWASEGLIGHPPLGEELDLLIWHSDTNSLQEDIA